MVVHGGGRAIDAELDRRAHRAEEGRGLRITDAPTLDVVVVGARRHRRTRSWWRRWSAGGVPAVGLTGVDAGFGRATRASAHRSTSGAVVDLGFVGDPVDADPSLIELLLVHGYVPVIASLGIAEAGRRAGILNVNADVMACRIAAALGGAISSSPARRRACSTATANRSRCSTRPASTGDCERHRDGRHDRQAVRVPRGAARGCASVRIIDGAGSTRGTGVDDTAPGTTLVLTGVAVAATGVKPDD